MGICMYHSVCGGQPTAYGSWFSPSACGSWGLSSGHQVWQQMLLLANPFDNPVSLCVLYVCIVYVCVCTDAMHLYTCDDQRRT